MVTRKAITFAFEDFQLTLFKAAHIDYGYIAVYEDAYGDITVSEGSPEGLIKYYKEGGGYDLTEQINNAINQLNSI